MRDKHLEAEEYLDHIWVKERRKRGAKKFEVVFLLFTFLKSQCNEIVRGK